MILIGDDDVGQGRGQCQGDSAQLRWKFVQWVVNEPDWQ